MQCDTDYLKSLATELRWRRLEEDRVREILAATRATLAAGERTGQETFGDPNLYASTFGKGKARHRGHLLNQSATAVAFIALVGFMVLNSGRGLSSIATNVVALVIAVAVSFTCYLVGQRLDNGVPEQESRGVGA